MRGSKVEFEENLEKLLGELGKENLERKKDQRSSQKREEEAWPPEYSREEGSGEQSWRILFTCMSE